MFAGWMAYSRFWFKKYLYAVTLGGGQMNNPGRYLTLLPPINGATATTGTPYFTENAGDRSQMHDGGITQPNGAGGYTNNGYPTQYACAGGAASGYGYGSLSSAETACLALGNDNSKTPTSAIWWPDLRTNQTSTTLAIMVRF
jgi:hypothetical protein